MSKTSNYEKRPRDFYPTPEKAVLPLKEHLPDGFTFCEPCAGDGVLVTHLEELFRAACFAPFDLEPQQDWITQADTTNLSYDAVQHCDFIITNPPFTWSVLKPMLDSWIKLKPTVLLLPADFMHNLRFTPYLAYCHKIVSIGRIKWIEGSKTSGVENYAWYFFWPEKEMIENTRFYGRVNG